MSDVVLRRNLQVVDSTMRPNPAFVDDLHATLAAELGFGAMPQPAERVRAPARPQFRRSGRLGWLAVAALLVLALLALLLGQLGRTPDESPPPPSSSPSAQSTESISPIPSSPLAALPSPIPALDNVRGNGRIIFEVGDLVVIPRLRVLQPDLASTELLPDLPGVQYRAAWRPDGERLAFTTYDPALLDSRPRIWETNAAGSDQVLLSEQCEAPTCIAESEPAYSPDGTRLAFVRTRSVEGGDPSSVIAIRDLATGAVTELEATSRPRSEEENLHPRWAPDGQTIAYAAIVFDANGFAVGSVIHLIDADGANDRAVTSPGMQAGDPEWSIDGATILFGSQPIRAFYLGGTRDQERTHLYAMNADGSNVRQFELEGAVGAPSWTPTGGQILFSFVEGMGDRSPGHPRLYVMDPDGSNVLPVTTSIGTPALYAAQQPVP